MVEDKDIALHKTPQRPPANPRWQTEEYEGMERDMADDTFAGMYWSIRDSAEERGVPFDEKDAQAQAQAISDAMTRAAIHSKVIKDAMGRAHHINIQRVKNNGFYRTSGEFDDISQWLMSRIPEYAEDSGRLSDIMFLHNVLVPTIQKLGNGTVADLTKIPENWIKTTSAVPYLRDAADIMEAVEKKYDKDLGEANKRLAKLQQKIGVLSPENEQRLEFEEQVRQINLLCVEMVAEKDEQALAAAQNFKEAFVTAMKVIQNPKIPAWGPNSVGKVLRRGKVVIFKGEKCILADGSVVFQVVLPADYEMAMESMNRQLIDFGMTDGKLMVSDLGKLVLKKTGGR
jgi:hypothetical protein